MAFVALTWNEHRMWSPTQPFGGGFSDERSITRANADLIRFEKEQTRLHELLTVDPSLSDEAAYVDRLIGWTQQRIAVLEAQRAAIARQVAAEKLAAEIREQHGLGPLAVVSEEIAAVRDAAHAAELAALLAEQRARGPAFDPNSKEGKKQLAAEADAKDPYRPGAPRPVTAEEVIRAGGRPIDTTPTPTEPAPAKSRDVVSRIRERLG
jgi:hypothetical protein